MPGWGTIFIVNDALVSPLSFFAHSVREVERCSEGTQCSGPPVNVGVQVGVFWLTTPPYRSIYPYP